MRITESQLRQIVKEEIKNLAEGMPGGYPPPKNDKDALAQILEILMYIDYESYETMERAIRRAIAICNGQGVFSKQY